MHRFYLWKRWKHVRLQVLEDNNYECAICKARGKYTRATTVHHVLHVRDYPQYALMPYIINAAGKKIQQLLPVCDACHNELHPEKLRARKKNKNNYRNEEKW